MLKKYSTFLMLIIAICTFGQNEVDRFQLFQKKYEEAVKISEDSAYSITQTYLNTFSNQSINQKVQKYEADYFYVTNQRAKADSIYKIVTPVFLAEKDYATLFKIYNRQGLFYYQTGKHKKGLTFSNEVQEFIDKNQPELTSRTFQIEIAELYRVIGIIYATQAETDDTFNQETSKKYFKKAYKTILPLKAYELEGLLAFNLGNIMASEDSTLYYWNKALQVFDRPELEHKKEFVYQNMAILHIDKEDYKQGLYYLNKTEPLVKKSQEKYSDALLNVKYGKTYSGLKEFDKSIKFLNKSLDTAIKYEMTSIQDEAYELLIRAYKETNQFKKALDTYVKYDTLIKRLDRIETERIFRDTEAKYKTKEQKAEISLLNQTKLLNNAKIKQQQLIIVLVIFTLLLIGILSYFLWKQSKQQKKLNAKLQKIDKDRTRFLVNISHELRTPITLIHGPLQDTFEQIDKKNYIRVKRNLQKINNNTLKLLQLTDEVLDISKIDEGFLEVKTKPILLNTFLNKAFYAFESLAIRNKIQWISSINIDNNAYEIDENKLEKILNNLLSNAIKHTPKNGKVEFSAYIANSKLHFNVEDSGKGISEKAISKIFDRYYQDDSREQPASGIGIGLSLVKELIDVLKGSISVTSELGSGTNFTVELPIKLSDKPAVNVSLNSIQFIDVENRPDIDLSNTDKPHILVIEDHIEMADFIQQLLSDDYRVSLANNGKEGIKRLQSETFDLITVDVMMPEMDGIEFVKNLKEHPKWKSISSIMITALSEEADKITGLQLGIDDYMTKPFNGNELKARVRNLIANSLVRKNTPNDAITEEIVGIEKDFLDKAKEIVKSNISNNAFTVKEMASHLNLSERQTNRVLKKATGLSCLQFIREVRLQTAYNYIVTRKHTTIAEISYAVGFENASYFTRIFAQRFGKKPSEML